MGFSPTSHHIELLRDKLISQGVMRSTYLKDAREGAFVKVAGLVVCRQRPPTAKGFCFLTLEDEYAMMNLVISPVVYEHHRVIFRRAKMVLAEGKKESRDGVINIKVHRIYAISNIDKALKVQGCPIKTL